MQSDGGTRHAQKKRLVFSSFFLFPVLNCIPEQEKKILYLVIELSRCVLLDVDLFFPPSLVPCFSFAAVRSIGHPFFFLPLWRPVFFSVNNAHDHARGLRSTPFFPPIQALTGMAMEGLPFFYLVASLLLPPLSQQRHMFPGKAGGALRHPQVMPLIAAESGRRANKKKRPLVLLLSPSLFSSFFAAGTRGRWGKQGKDNGRRRGRGVQPNKGDTRDSLGDGVSAPRSTKPTPWYAKRQPLPSQKTPPRIGPLSPMCPSPFWRCLLFSSSLFLRERGFLLTSLLCLFVFLFVSHVWI